MVFNIRKHEVYFFTGEVCWLFVFNLITITYSYDSSMFIDVCSDHAKIWEKKKYNNYYNNYNDDNDDNSLQFI